MHMAKTKRTKWFTMTEEEVKNEWSDRPLIGQVVGYENVVTDRLVKRWNEALDGYEVERGPTYDDKEMKTVKKRTLKQLIKGRPAFVLYAIDASVSTFNDLDIAAFQTLDRGDVPFYIVLVNGASVPHTRIEQLLETFRINRYRAVSPETDPTAWGTIEETFGNEREELLERVVEHVRLDSLNETKEEVEKAIRQHVAASFAVGFTPIPFADGPILLANQGKMISRIFKAYELGGFWQQAQTLVGTLGAGQLLSQLGRYVAAQVLKFIPGVGTIAGGMINGTVASAITVALGLTVSEMGYEASKKQLVDEDVDIDAFLQETFGGDTVKTMFQQFFERETERLKDKK